jgi:hypothetical protein
MEFGPNQLPTGMSTAVASDKHAVMYVFSPKRIADHYKRPIIYNFNGQFMEDVYETLSDGRSGGNPLTSGPIHPNLDRLYNLPSAKSVILPSAQGYNLQTSRLSDFWTFILIVDNDEYSLGFKNNQLRNRTLYYGYCLEEPINPHNLGNGNVVNMGAFLIVTHKSIINLNTTIGAYGPKTSQDTVSDVDAVPGQSLSTLTNESMVLMTPSNLRKMADALPDGSITSIIGTPDILQNKPKHDTYSSNVNIPHQHTKKIINNVIRGIEDVGYDAYSGTLSEHYRSAHGLPGEFGRDVVANQIDNQFYAETTNELYVGLPINEPINMGILMRTYDPDIQPVYQDLASQFDPIPQSYTSANNIFSSLIASAMPAILSNVGLMSLGFHYHSPYRNLQLLNAESFIVCTQQELECRVRTAIRILERDLFDIIKANQGEFDLSCNCSCGGDSHIVLNLLDSTPHQGIYQNNNVLGGINSQLIGDTNCTNSNIANLGNFINCIANDI